MKLNQHYPFPGIWGIVIFLLVDYSYALKKVTVVYTEAGISRYSHTMRISSLVWSSKFAQQMAEKYTNLQRRQNMYIRSLHYGCYLSGQAGSGAHSTSGLMSILLLHAGLKCRSASLTTHNQLVSHGTINSLPFTSSRCRA
jgi:hypothetical protein